METVGVVSPAATGSQLGSALLAGVIVYFAPTLLAVMRHRGAAPSTFFLNLFLGWTGVGWVLAWLMALADRRLHIYVTSPVPTPAATRLWPVQSPTVTLAPDGRHWWDGCEWRDGWQIQPIGALRSPDGARWFTGAEWVPVGVAGCACDASTSVGREEELLDEPEWWRHSGPGKG